MKHYTRFKALWAFSKYKTNTKETNTKKFQSPLGVLQIYGKLEVDPQCELFQSPLGVLQIYTHMIHLFIKKSFKALWAFSKLTLLLRYWSLITSFKALWAFSKSYYPKSIFCLHHVSKPFGRSPNKILPASWTPQPLFQSPLGVLQIWRVAVFDDIGFLFQSPLGVLQMKYLLNR